MSNQSNCTELCNLSNNEAHNRLTRLRDLVICQFMQGRNSSYGQPTLLYGCKLQQNLALSAVRFYCLAKAFLGDKGYKIFEEDQPGYN